MDDQKKRPNARLKQERNVRGWSQEDLAEKVGTTQKIVSRWERGISTPLPYYRQKLCQLFGKNAEELGFLDAAAHDDSQEESLHVQAVNTPGAFRGENALIERERGNTQPKTLLRAEGEAISVEDATPDQQLGVWLALSTQNLTPLFDEGWTPHMILEALHILLPGVQAMSQISRRTFGHHLLQLGATAFLSGVPLPTGKHVSADEKMRLCQTLGESIAAGWKLFHTAGNAQVLAIGQAELALVQQAHAALYPRDRCMFYSSVYNLIGMAQQLRGRNEEALQAHTNAHIAALGTGDPWYVVQSLLGQVNAHQALGQHSDAIETIEEALRTIGHRDVEHLRSRAHLLGCWADSAMTIGENTMAQQKLNESAGYLDQIGPNEEFDRANWLQLAGKYTFMTGDYTGAIQHLDASLAALPPNWIVRKILILLPLIATYAHQRDREMSFGTADKALSTLDILNAPSLSQTFSISLRGLLEAFPNDPQVHTFVTDRLHQVPDSLLAGHQLSG